MSALDILILAIGGIASIHWIAMRSKDLYFIVGAIFQSKKEPKEDIEKPKNK